MKSFVNHFLKRNNNREDEVAVQDLDPCQQSESGRTRLQEAGVTDSLSKFTLSLQRQNNTLRLPINDVFSAIKDQPWVRGPKPIQHDSALSEVEDYYSYHDSKGHKIVHYKSLR